MTGDIAGNYTNTISAGSLTTNEGATNHDPATDTLVVTGASSAGGSGGNRGDGNQSSAVSGFLIPVTGFTPDTITELDESVRAVYSPLNIAIEIPVINVNTSISGVQIKNGGWDVS